ncbi:MAG: WG repeat-containing protein [Cyanobacteriota bacterium]|nr:WG repeat-containing protein [Cyanobacteriota bacterium]
MVKTKKGLRNIAIAATTFWNLQATAASGFTDISGHWNETCIRQLAAQNLVSGYPDGTFKPEANVTRAEFALLAYRTAEVFFHHSHPQRGSMAFADVPQSHWARGAIQQAYQYYLFAGYPDGSFRPDRPIPRVQSLVVLANALNFRVPENADEFLRSKFDDRDRIPQWAQKSIAAATLGRIAVSYPDPRQLNPNRNATRAEVAGFMCQARSLARTVPIEYIGGGDLGLAIVPEMGGIGSFAEGLLLASGNGKYGYLDTEGNIAIPFQFEAAKSFSGGLAAAKSQGKWGYLDKQGNWAIAPQFEGAGDFSEDLAIVSLPEGKGILHRTGTMQAQISTADLQSLLPTGETIDDFQIAPFADGLARVTVRQNNPYTHYTGFIDPKGAWAIALQENPMTDFSEGFAAIEVDGNYGYADKTGEIIIAPQFHKVQPFSEGLAAVELKAPGASYSSRTWGYIDRTGEIVIQPTFYSARSFSEGLAAVYDRDFGSGYIDRTGTPVISSQNVPELSGVFPFVEGVAQVSTSDGYGYIDRAGNVVVEPQFASAGIVSEGMARVDISGQWVDRLGGYDGSAVPIFEARLEGSQWGYVRVRPR